MTVASVRALRPVHCVTRHLHRDIECAREITCGRFHLGGTTLIMPGVPRWCDTSVDSDLERWIEWSKFYYGLDLAFAYAETGDSMFAATWERLVSSWIDQMPPDVGPTDALGRRLQNWIYAYDAFLEVPGFDGFTIGFDERLARRIGNDADYLQQHLTPERNHRTLELYALFITALALPPTDRERRRLEFAWRGLQQNLEVDFRPDGVHREHSTHYHMVVLRSFIGARENARRAGLDVPDAFDRSLRRALEFAMHCHRPDGTVPPLSDGDVGAYAEQLEQAAGLLHLPDVLFVATNGARGTPPATTCADFIDSGYFVQRSAWSDIASGGFGHRHLIFDCGALGDGGHGHYDTLSVVAWCGQDLLVDPGRYTYEAASAWRHWFKGTAAHNTVCVDGRDQTAFLAGKPKKRPAATLLARYSRPLLEVVGGQVVTSEYDAIHRRHVLFVASEYWVVVDHLEGRTAHDYDLRFHLPAEAADATAVSERRVIAPAVTLLLHGPGAVRLEQGWVAAQYGVKSPAPVIAQTASQCVSAEFVTAIIPTSGLDIPSDSPRLAVTVRGDGSTEALIEGVGPDRSWVDSIAWSLEPSGRCNASVSRRAG